MTTEQIIKALECCSKDDCDNCPNGFGNCYANLAGYALALIKSQQGQIVGLNSAIETLQGVAKDYENHNETLKRENKYLRERLAEEMEHKEDMSVEFTCVFSQPHKVSDCPITEEIDKAKADTVKKMQERIHEAAWYFPMYEEERHLIDIGDIDQIAKEILEGSNEVQE